MIIDHFDIIDLPEWRPLAIMPNASASGVCLAGDLRNNEDRHPEIFQLVSATVLNAYHTKNDGPMLIGSPALTGTFGAGADMKVLPSQGPRGTIAAGATTQKITLSTALPAAVGVGQLAGRGDGQGFKIRIIDNGAGGTGKTEEKYVINNTGGTTPVITLDSVLSFTPVTNATYEFLSGRVYMLSAGTLAAGMWKWYDILTNSFSGNLATTNLPATIGTDSDLVPLDELLVPNDKLPGQGFIGVQTATAIAATTITGPSGPLVANEYRNFQIRIVEDTTNPTAAGQRRKITSHTGKALATDANSVPVFTVPTWTVTPSATAKYVIENSNEVLLFTSASATTYCYAPQAIGAQAADSWSSTTYAARGSAVGAGVCGFQAFGLTIDTDKNLRHSFLYSFRGGASAALDLLDLAGGATGLWSNAIVYGSGPTLTTGSSLIYDPTTNGGKFAYININGLQNMYRFNAMTRQLNEWAQLRFTQGAALVGSKMAYTVAIDPADSTKKIGNLICLKNTGAELFSLFLER
jgi:hypothetical protein